MTQHRHVCIHGHFYQPPRENPWIEAVEQQDSAAPYHDWNERITAEAYGPNATSRILDEDGLIARIANNYSRISFNFGPTLLSWLEAHAPDVYRAILDADRESRQRFSGHGSALAQTFHHLIAPLASQRDQLTQARWGVCDFEHRFGRRPEGMWLAECAVDVASLEALAEVGVGFTILAPRQARRVRPIGDEAWLDVHEHSVDPSIPYRVTLPSGRTIAVFFYDGPISRAVAFERLLEQGERLADRLLGALRPPDDARPQLVHIATDGETYGHHHRFGDMALACALQHIEDRDDVALTNYGEYLERHPPTHEAEIVENSSWSCVHGIERWRGDCGCNSGGRPDWHQAWRAPLREALDELRERLAERYERATTPWLKDPWAARDDYVEVVLDRSEKNVEAFFARHKRGRWNAETRVNTLKALEMQRHAMQMFTSCGWFFDEVSGIETVQILQYAGRALQLAQELGGADDLEEVFLKRLESAPSNLVRYGHARGVWDAYVRPRRVNLDKVAAHYAIRSAFETYDTHAHVYCYTVELSDARERRVGRSRLAAGRGHMTCDLTGETTTLSFLALHFGGHNVNAGVRLDEMDAAAFDAMSEEALDTFEGGDFAEVVRCLDRHFEGEIRSFKSLFHDEQRRLLDQLLAATLEETETVYTQLYDRHAPLMRFLGELDIPLPKAFRVAAETALTGHLRRMIQAERPDRERINNLLEEARTRNVELDMTLIEYTVHCQIEHAARAWRETPADPETLDRFERVVSLLDLFAFRVDLAVVQNLYYEARVEFLPPNGAPPPKTDAAWIERFRAIGQGLGMALP